MISISQNEMSFSRFSIWIWLFDTFDQLNDEMKCENVGEKRKKKKKKNEYKYKLRKIRIHTRIWHKR